MSNTHKSHKIIMSYDDKCGDLITIERDGLIWDIVFKHIENKLIASVSNKENETVDIIDLTNDADDPELIQKTINTVLTNIVYKDHQNEIRTMLVNPRKNHKTQKTFNIQITQPLLDSEKTPIHPNWCCTLQDNKNTVFIIERNINNPNKITITTPNYGIPIIIENNEIFIPSKFISDDLYKINTTIEPQIEKSEADTEMAEKINDK